MSAVAIITARGGSKRIPKKNIKEFCGKPIIAYSIEAALKSELFDEVMVSTDSEEIAEVARRYDAKVPFMRSAKNSDDFAGTDDVLEEVVNTYKEKGDIFSWFACIYPTAPLISIRRLKEAFSMFQKRNSDMVEAVVQFSYPPQRGYIMDNGDLLYKWPQFENSRSQDLEKFYHDAGQFYFFRTESFLNMRQKNMSMQKTAIVLDEIEVQDIDNLSDWEMAEMKYRILLEQGKLK